MRNDQDRLADVVQAAARIADRVSRGRERFDADEDLQLAMVRLVEIVGEACAGLSADVRDSYPETPWRAAADMRNRVIHGYFDVDLDVVWGAAVHEIPALAAAAARALNRLETGEDH